ncbi:hypothetical protein O3P69_011619 [Scylla paramamosain]|uniref:Uncharacterized protein n=1 Tax=Scylla paramamosain TaxID=85552 RepID=A0AAW0T740_SCYPA
MEKEIWPGTFRVTLMRARQWRAAACLAWLAGRGVSWRGGMRCYMCRVVSCRVVPRRVVSLVAMRRGTLHRHSGGGKQAEVRSAEVRVRLGLGGHSSHRLCRNWRLGSESPGALNSACRWDSTRERPPYVSHKEKYARAPSCVAVDLRPRASQETPRNLACEREQGDRSASPRLRSGAPRQQRRSMSRLRAPTWHKTREGRSEQEGKGDQRTSGAEVVRAIFSLV